jgi:hypothetical protein
VAPAVVTRLLLIIPWAVAVLLPAFTLWCKHHEGRATDRPLLCAMWCMWSCSEQGSGTCKQANQCTPQCMCPGQNPQCPSRRKNPTPVQIDADHFKLMLMASNRCNCRSI